MGQSKEPIRLRQRKTASGNTTLYLDIYRTGKGLMSIWNSILSLRRTGKTAGQQRVPASYLENLLIPIPPLIIQKQIAENYSRTINLIKKGYKTIHNLTIELKQIPNNRIKTNFREQNF